MINNKQRINKKHIESIKYLKKYRFRARLEKLKIFFFSYLLKFVIMLTVASFIVFAFYKTIKWKELVSDYKNSSGLIFENTENKKVKIDNGISDIDIQSLSSVELPIIIYKDEEGALTGERETYLKSFIVFLQKKNINIKQIDIEKYGDVCMYTDLDYKIRFNFKNNIEDIINNFQFMYIDNNTNKIILNKNNSIDYLDMRFGDRVYYKDKDRTGGVISEVKNLKINDVDVIVPESR